MLVPKHHIDLMYLNQISYKLLRFRKANGVYVCRCPFCGDSKTDKKKARFYFYTKKNNLNTICHNCGHSSSFWNFLKQFDSITFEEYKKDTIFDAFRKPEIKVINNVVKPTVRPSKPESKQLLGCVNMNVLKEGHPALDYVLARGFTEDMISKLYYTDNFKQAASSINKESTVNLSDVPEPRIIIPFYNDKKEIQLIQGRSLNPKNKLRYITIKINEDVSKIYGLDTLDKNKTVYCCEGPLDALFIDNCVATCDGNLLAYQEADVYIPDNQPRNKDVIRVMENVIDAGKSIVIWPNSPNTKQDINDLILMGINRDELMEVIRMRTFSGIRAKAELSRWRKL